MAKVFRKSRLAAFQLMSNNQLEFCLLNFKNEDLPIDSGQDFATAYHAEHGRHRNWSMVRVPVPQQKCQLTLECQNLPIDIFFFKFYERKQQLYTHNAIPAGKRNCLQRNIAGYLSVRNITHLRLFLCLSGLYN